MSVCGWKCCNGYCKLVVCVSVSACARVVCVCLHDQVCVCEYVCVCACV